MELLVCVLNREEKLERLLSLFAKIGITGATVLDSRGMGRVLGDGVPAFGSLQALSSLTRDKNVTIFSVVEDPEKLSRARQAIAEVCGDLESPSTGIVFTVPVSSVMGIAAESPIGTEHSPAANGD